MAQEITTKRDELAEHYLKARDWISSSPFVRDLEWQLSSACSTSVSETEFLREYAWVVLNSGFKESVVRKYFDFISLCFCDWESAVSITNSGEICIECALSVFSNRRKLEAIFQTALIIANTGFDTFIGNVQACALDQLEVLPYIGAVTKWHLAKNIGFDVAKPDRHLVRLAQQFGYTDIQLMCRDAGKQCGDTIAVADLVLWRFEERHFRRSIGARAA